MPGAAVRIGAIGTKAVDLTENAVAKAKPLIDAMGAAEAVKLIQQRIDVFTVSIRTIAGPRLKDLNAAMKTVSGLQPLETVTRMFHERLTGAGVETTHADQIAPLLAVHMLRFAKLGLLEDRLDFILDKTLEQPALVAPTEPSPAPDAATPGEPEII